MAAIANSFWGLTDRIAEVRTRLNLVSPGPYENLHREIRGMLPTYHQIDGAKFELQSILSQNFQTSHTLSWGSAQNPPSYQFGATYATAGYLFHGQIDHDGSLQARAHYNWIPAPMPTQPPAQDPNNPSAEPQPPVVPEPPRISSTTKAQALINNLNPAHNMLVLEHDHNDLTWSLNVKSINANPIDTAPSWAKSKNGSAVTGTFSVSYLQSISRSFAVGSEFTYQRAVSDLEEPSLAFAIRYAPPPAVLPAPAVLPPGFPSPYMPVNPKDSTQVFTTTWAPATGLLNSTYWRRLNQRLEVGAELQMLLTPFAGGAPGKREGIATMGFKLDTIFASIRGMIDTHGRVSAVVEEMIAPGIKMQLSGEIDYARGGPGSGRVGLGFSLEA
ncbi:eukaryotic porin-domain-containing protein [Entophlyctis helioformis]|nr:eukaryotic porin-domain-containing protein [Entophlyctis helioformis]